MRQMRTMSQKIRIETDEKMQWDRFQIDEKKELNDNENKNDENQ